MLTVEERFWAKVDKDGDCWTWMARRQPRGGYGQFQLDGRTRSAHRVAWTLTNGPIPDGLCVLHRCDNPPCVNPEHLWLGTKAENNQDMTEKGRRFSPTHCKHGHEFTEKNTYIYKRQRFCRTCNTLSARTRREAGTTIPPWDQKENQS